MKKILSKEDVIKAIASLQHEGKKVTLQSLHAAVGNKGSLSTLVKIKGELDAAAAQPSVEGLPPEAVKAFRIVWDSAVNEGHKQEELKLQDLEQSLNALAAENERLEGVTNAAKNRLAELETAKSQADEELKMAQRAVIESQTQAATALQRLADTQQRFADTQITHEQQVKTLRDQLATAEGKLHELELKLVQVSTQLEAKEKPVA